MPHYRLALLGFGNVGKALARLLLAKETELRESFGITFQVNGIATGRHGWAIDPSGINLHEALAAGVGAVGKNHPLTGSPDFIRRCPADVLFENSPVNYETGQPAVDHLRLALEQGMHAITANKGPVVHAFQELSGLARKQGKKFFFESSVMDGAPIFSLFRAALPAARLQSLRGILNSTTNMILSRMEAGESFEQAVSYCQQIGIAETDPSGDVDGWDAAVKVAALATVLMGAPLLPQNVERQGIRGMTAEQIQQAAREHRRWKLICTAERQGDRVAAKVAPELVGPESPFYGVTGTSSVVTFYTDVLPSLSIVEGNPGVETTAYGLLADFINAARSENNR